MILSYNFQGLKKNENENINYNKNKLEIKRVEKGKQEQPVSKNVNTNNIFAFDVKFSKIFDKSKDGIIANDEDFFNDSLEKEVVKINENSSNENSNSVHEENFLNRDMLTALNLLNVGFNNIRLIEMEKHLRIQIQMKLIIG
jgi:hypothetical protein